MKNSIQILILGFFIYSCSTIKDRILDMNSTHNNPSDTIRITNNKLEYEILIIEPGFSSWISTQKPRGFYTEQYLENKNRQCVLEYNQRVLQPQRFSPELYEQQINYESNVQYGYEVNYMLYNYFLYFEQRYNQRLKSTFKYNTN